jgi:shikimate dehydrogenase
MMIDQHTSLYAVVGKPVRHSLSPVMQNAAFRKAGLNAVYLAFEPENAEELIRGMRAFSLRGLSVTIPFKESVVDYLDHVDPLAEKIGAVNTIVNRAGQLTGYNTDASGALRALEDVISVNGKRCLVLGAGGAARAVGFGLKQKGGQVVLVNRSEERGQALAKALECEFVPLKQAEDRRADILVQTTPVGMFPDVDGCPIPETSLRRDMIVMDIIYNPLETKLLKMAGEQGCQIISGLHMFVYQGADQFTLWTGLDAPIESMRNAVLDALNKANR